MSAPDPPNLFSYATSELSQDAWICWLVAHVDSNTRSELRHAARDFVARLWNAAHPAQQIAADEVRGLRAGDPRRQVEHVDVLFEVDVGQRRAVFVIEDKTHSTHHSEQLARYKRITEQAHGHAQIVLIYFKTGYHFEHDAAACAHGYGVVSLDQVVDFVRAHDEVSSDIFRDYAQHQLAAHGERARAIASLDGAEGAAELKHDFVQHVFLARLRDRAGVAGDELQLHHGRSLGGAPWTNWEFAAMPRELAGGIAERLFHRVDARQDGKRRRYYLSTRQYARVKGAPNARSEKVTRLGQYRALFRDAVRTAAGELRFAKASGDHSGANESEIGVLFFDEAQPPSVVLERFPAVHRAFVERLSAEGCR